MTSTKVEPAGTCDVDFASDICIKRILVPIDFTSNSRHALPYAVNLARNFGAKISLIHVVGAARSTDLEQPNVHFEHKGHEADIEKDLAHLAGEELETKIRGGVIVVRGSPPYEIDRVAARLRMDLIVTATHARTGLEHFAFGSTAQGIIHNAPCPVLVVPEPLVHICFPGDGGFERILAPVGPTIRLSPALDYAAALARRYHADITLLYTVSKDGALPGPPGAPDAANQLELLRQKLVTAGARAAAVVSGGVPSREIVQFARTQKTDVIVVTWQSVLGLRKYFGSGTAEVVVRHAPCPVLVIRLDTVVDTPGHSRKEQSMAKAV